MARSTTANACPDKPIWSIFLKEFSDKNVVIWEWGNINSFAVRRNYYAGYPALQKIVSCLLSLRIQIPIDLSVKQVAIYFLLAVVTIFKIYLYALLIHLLCFFSKIFSDSNLKSMHPTIYIYYYGKVRYLIWILHTHL